MKSAEVYRQLHLRLGDGLKRDGFRRSRQPRLVYQRPRAGLVQTIRWECDAAGWDPQAGSSLWLSFVVSSRPDHFAADRREERLNAFLTDEELEAARRLRDQVVARIPAPPEGYFAGLEASFARRYPDAVAMVAAVRARFEPERLPYRRNQDFSLRYWSPDDIRAWADFVEPLLPRILATLDQWQPVRR